MPMKTADGLPSVHQSALSRTGTRARALARSRMHTDSYNVTHIDGTFGHAHTPAHTPTHACMRTYMHTYTRIPTHTHADMHAEIHTAHTHAHLYVCTCRANSVAQPGSLPPIAFVVVKPRCAQCRCHTSLPRAARAFVRVRVCLCAHTHGHANTHTAQKGRGRGLGYPSLPRIRERGE